jgi:hypothetical protein
MGSWGAWHHVDYDAPKTCWSPVGRRLRTVAPRPTGGTSGQVIFLGYITPTDRRFPGGMDSPARGLGPRAALPQTKPGKMSIHRGELNREAAGAAQGFVITGGQRSPPGSGRIIGYRLVKGASGAPERFSQIIYPWAVQVTRGINQRSTSNGWRACPGPGAPS